MEGTIKIFGNIGNTPYWDGIELVDIISQVKKQPEATSFKVLINSEGGRVDTGFDIYNYLTKLGLPITTVGSGVVASMATVIFMAGSRRIVQKGTQFMIHLPIAGGQGTAEEMLELSKEIKKVERRIMRFYMDKFNLTQDALEPLLKNETWLTEEQLSDLEIITDPPVNVAAKASIDNSQPKKHTEMDKGKKPGEGKNGKDRKNVIEQVMDLLKGVETGAGNDPINKILLDAEMREVEFPEVDEDTAVSVGDAALVDNAPAEGEITMQDGRTFVFENGILNEIREPGNGGEGDDGTETVDALKKQLEDKEAELATMKAQKEKAENDLAAAQKEIKGHKVIFNKLKELETGHGGTDPRDGGNPKPGKKPSRFKAALNGVKR